jgi:membrane protein
VRDTSPETPEARRQHPDAHPHRPGLWGHIGPGSRYFEVTRRIAVGVYNDGFIHAGNLAYLTLLTIFPFFIVIAALAQLVGDTGEVVAAIRAVMVTVPRSVATMVEETANQVLTARTGSLLWFGGLIGLWTVGSFIETIRDILRRAYGTDFGRPFWQNRLLGIVLVFAAVALLMAGFSAQIMMTAAQELLSRYVPATDRVTDWIASSQFIPLIAIYFAIFLMFCALTPLTYRGRRFPKWPGALLATLWWYGVLALLPRALDLLGGYALTYGGLAGVMIALVFFWFVGFGMVIGAHLNAALADAGQNGLKPDADDNGIWEAQWLDT